ncbi:glycosyltransferase [Cellvibrio sp. ARAG 10.3]|uniref:glycosyltransferase n=1 Tax=Cellvibrio sp. ARAG 10.3 TaxID=3451358 RepID=UPI003F469547
MKKILWLSHLLPYPPKGGVLQRSYNLIKEVSKRHHITLLAFNQKNLCASPEELREGIKHLSQFCDVVDVVPIEADSSKLSKVKLLAKGLLPGNTYTVNWLKSSRYQAKLSEILAGRTFDLIHADTISLAPYVAHLKEYKKILNHHNIESLMMLRRSENEPNVLKKIYFFQEGKKLMNYEKRICKRFDLNITCSDLDAERLNDIAPDVRSLGIPNGVDLDYFSPLALPIKEKSIVFAGGLSWYPNLDAMKFFLTHVWPKLNQEIPDVSMTIIGRSPPPWMQQLQEKYPNLTITGFVDDVRPYLAKAALYVCPIRDGGGTKLKVLDALAMGKTLIANPIACEGITVEHMKNVIFAATPTDYISAIKNAFESPALTQTIARNARKLIEEKYNFKSIGASLSEAVEEVCHQ